ncbi:MAG: hypothetical protein H7Y38_05830 [Armatimonadetes bacterium]|nr:hypothetical protein [Armatimonadota bacterium]
MTKQKQHQIGHLSVILPLVATGVALLALPVAPSHAQGTTAPTNIVPLPTSSDMFRGQDKPGPYQLTWKKLPPRESFAPVVVVDDKTLSADAYEWNAEKGTITFNEPLKAVSMARIVFSYDPDSSERNASPASAPITVPLLRAGSTQLQLTALTGTGTQASGEDALLVWGLSGAPTRAMGGTITTKALLAPDASQKDGDEAGANLWERAGLNVGYLMGTETSGLEAKYARGGRSFAPLVGKSLGMNAEAGDSRFLAARYALAPWLRAEWKQDTMNFAGGDSAQTSQTMLFRMGGVKNQPALNFERTDNGSTNKDGVSSGTLRDKLELQAKLGGQVALSGTAETAKKTDGTDSAAEKTTNLALSVSAVSNDKSQKADVAVTDVSKNTGNAIEANSGVSVTLQASPSVTIVAEQTKQAISTTPKEGEGEKSQKEQIKAEAKIALAPGASLAGGVAVDSSEKSDAKTERQATTISAKIGEGKAVELSQIVISRAGTATGNATLDTTDTRLLLRPVRGLTLSGALINNPEKDGRITGIKRQELGMKATVGALELGSGYALSELGTQEGYQTGEFSLSLGLRFNQYTRFTGEYKDGLFWGNAEGVDTAARGMRVFSLGLTHALGTAFNFSLGGNMEQEKAGGVTPDDYKANATLGVKF